MSRQNRHRPEAPKPDDTRLALLRAVVAALPRRWPNNGQYNKDTNPPVSTFSAPHAEHAVDSDSWKQSACDPSENIQVEFLNLLVAPACADADAVGQFLSSYLAHLESLGCASGDVPDYVQLEKRVLASLYVASSQPAPSPMEMRQLGLRLALDARQSIDRPVHLYHWDRTDQGWVITKYPSSQAKLVPLPPPGSRTLVRNPLTNAVLDCLLAPSPDVFQLRWVIEQQLGYIPQRSDTLEGAALPSFTYAITRPNKTPEVCLRINGKLVPLPPRADVHRLLELLCKRPKGQYKGRQLARDHGICNASQAATAIRNALERLHPGSGAWLHTSPIHWAEEHVPTATRGGCDNS
jgi:hypothetical protein